MVLPAITTAYSYPGDRTPGAYPAGSRPAGVAFRDVLEFEQLSRSSSPGSAPTRDQVHTVKRGDTLWHICRRHLVQRGTDEPSDADICVAVRKVARANNLRNPDLILIGQEIDLAVLSGEPGQVSAVRHTTPPEARGGGAAVRVSSVSVVAPTVARLGPARLALARSAAPAPPSGKTVDLTGLIESILEPEPSWLPAVEVQSPWAGIIESPARLTSEFGMRRDPFTGRMAHHDGIDLAADPGAKIFAFMPGRVVLSGWRPGYGKMVVVRHANGLETVYGHNSKNLVRVGDRVNAVTPLGLVGATGRATGPHLHFEVRRRGRAIDPIPLITGDSRYLAKVR